MESKKQAGWQKMAEENGLAAIFRKLEIQEVAGRYAAILDNEAELMARRASFLNMPALTGNATWEAYALRDRLLGARLEILKEIAGRIKELVAGTAAARAQAERIFATLDVAGAKNRPAVLWTLFLKQVRKYAAADWWLAGQPRDGRDPARAQLISGLLDSMSEPDASK